jgi:ABC-type polysaccharide/polyol phosphate export permease
MLAKTDFKLRYHGSVLGYVWALLKPLLIFLVLNFVFTHIFGSDIEYYSLRLLTGIILWTFFVEGTMTGLGSLLSKSHILTRLPVSQMMLTVSSTMNVLMTYVINLVILALFYIWFGFALSLSQVILFLMISFQIYVLILGLSFLLAPLFVRFRDLNQIWEVLLTAGFYAAPVLYPLSIFPESVRVFLYLNPMTIPVQEVLFVFFGDHSVSSGVFLIYSIVLFVFVLLSLIGFSFFSRRLIEQL